MRNIALITGGTSGIGRAFANYFAGQGCDLILTGTKKSNDLIRSELEKKYKIEVKIIRANFKKLSDIKKLENYIKDLDISVLVNSAGFGNKTNFFEESIENNIEMINTHILATTKLTYLVGKKMIKRRGGTIVNISSLGAVLPVKNSIMYSATKAFLIPFTKSVHKNLKKYNIKVQVVIPGFVKTAFNKKEKANKLSILPMSPELVVKESINGLKNNKVVCIPGKVNKFIFKIFK